MDVQVFHSIDHLFDVLHTLFDCEVLVNEGLEGHSFDEFVHESKVIVKIGHSVQLPYILVIDAQTQFDLFDELHQVGLAFYEVLFAFNFFKKNLLRIP